MSDKLRIYNFISNVLIMALVIAAVFSMFFGSGGVLQSSNWYAFKFFTVDSNVLVGLTSLLSAIFLWKKGGDYPSWLIKLKLASTVSVGITFFTVAFYLGPIYSYSLMIEGPNLFMHLIVPVLSMVTFLLLEPRANLKFKYNFTSIIPVTIYGIAYLINVAATNDYGNVAGNDWYAFGTFGFGIGLVCLIVIIIMGFLISIGLSIGNKKIKLKELHS